MAYSNIGLEQIIHRAERILFMPDVWYGVVCASYVYYRYGLFFFPGGKIWYGRKKKKWIKKWHVCKTKKEMKQKTKSINENIHLNTFYIKKILCFINKTMEILKI